MLYSRNMKRTDRSTLEALAGLQDIGSMRTSDFEPDLTIPALDIAEFVDDARDQKLRNAFRTLVAPLIEGQGERFPLETLRELIVPSTEILARIVRSAGVILEPGFTVHVPTTSGYGLWFTHGSPGAEIAALSYHVVDSVGNVQIDNRGGGYEVVNPYLWRHEQGQGHAQPLEVLEALQTLVDPIHEAVRNL